MCNWDFADEIGKVFGCESPKYSRNILRQSSQEEVDGIVDRFWNPSGKTMTKEVWATKKLPQLKKHFRVVCFSRTPRMSMPPKRARVVAWMHAYSLQAGIPGDFKKSAFSAYSAMHRFCVAQARSLGLPLILWDEIIDSEESKIEKILSDAKMPGVDCAAAARLIVKSRSNEQRPTLEGWE